MSLSRPSRPRFTYANVTATAALVLALSGGGFAVAAGVGKNSVGSPQIRNGGVHSADIGANAVVGGKVRNNSLTGSDISESTLDLSKTRAGNVLAAVVDEDGTLYGNQSLYATDANKLDPGIYTVTFDRDVTTCAFVADVGLPGSVSSADPGFVTTVGYGGAPRSVYLRTYDAAGNAADRGFHLAVVC